MFTKATQWYRQPCQWPGLGYISQRLQRGESTFQWQSSNTACCLSRDVGSTPAANLPNSWKASSNLSKSTSEDPSSLLKSELESELSLPDSGELSLSIFTSPIVSAASLRDSSFFIFAFLAGGSTGRGTGVSLNCWATSCFTTRVGRISSSSSSNARAALVLRRKEFSQILKSHKSQQWKKFPSW